ncbi:Gfo/Idh/MocA family protein [Novipirellula artificiosorum]|uniref:Inositol 2-dehydrogenase/D-chiro-inositol 3-dehydrogenase n=1 Tax=Novipirellula artificiosorum TaxID=2528016 RepID=A0A5C6E590_9BACT|nr:Gfo/Idh/MocA family oxidoreductase [Novipirellula artificiosorum]TWU42761.1 Inositol 2-dehydrogenase/D-chiro-inositol 3-dehydrogenase [Novipirellula artificiosorum]
MPRSPQSSRRRFLKRSAAASAIALPYFIPQGVLAAAGRPGANDRVIIGFVGTGGRARQLMDHVPADGRIVSICDVYQQRMIDTLKEKQQNWKTYSSHEQMFESENLDAVVVATPDHARVLPCIHACQAELDIYAEKPLTLTIHEGRVLVNAVRKYNRVFQVGSQQRTMELNRFACELVRSGGIGKIKRVQGICYTGPRDYQGLPEQPIPEGDNWDVWQAQTEARPFNHALQFGWMGWRAYSGGEMTNWGAHGVDQIQWALGKSLTGPEEIWPVTPGPNGKVSMRYADGIQVDYELDKGPMGGGIFTGSDAKIEINRNKFTTNPPDFVRNPPALEEALSWEGAGWVARPHIQNWLDCIRTRKTPNADVEIGHRSISVCHLVNIARQVGRKLRWDPNEEQFPGDEEANAYLDRPRRQGWELPDLA